MKLLLDGAPVALDILRRVWEAPCEISIGKKARTLVRSSHAHVDAVVASGEQTYGVNTGCLQGVDPYGLAPELVDGASYD